MVANGGGNLVFLSSPVAFSSFLGYTGYAPSKAAVSEYVEPRTRSGKRACEPTYIHTYIHTCIHTHIANIQMQAHTPRVKHIGSTCVPTYTHIEYYNTNTYPTSETGWQRTCVPIEYLHTASSQIQAHTHVEQGDRHTHLPTCTANSQMHI
jgi:hypothetical protein